MRRPSPLAALTASVGTVLALAVGCSGGGGAPAAKLSVAGRTLVAAGGGALRPSNGTSLHAGDRVQVDEGTATIGLNGGRQLELAAGARLDLQPGAGGQPLRPSLGAGDVLVTAGTESASVAAADTLVSVTRGSARVQRGLAVVVASYTADVVVSSAGRSINVSPLRQVSVPAAGLIPPGTSPLALLSSNPWDQRFLGDAIELGNQLVARSRGFTAQLAPGEGHTPGFYRQILPALDQEPAFDTLLLDPARPPGETLVGLAIALQSRRGTFPERLAGIYSFHDQGAAWGLVALDQGVSRAPLVAGIDEAIAKGPPSTAERPATSAAPAPRSSRTSSPTRSRRATGAGSVTAGPSSSVPGTQAGGTGPGPVQTGVPLVDNTVNSLVDLLSGLLSAVGNK